MFPVLFDANFRDKQLANVLAHWLKPSEPSEPSAMDVGCSTDSETHNDKSTSIISTLTANAAAITTTTIATDTNNAIYRLGGTDTWACKNCKIKADKWFMYIHDCSGKR